MARAPARAAAACADPFLPDAADESDERTLRIGDTAVLHTLYFPYCTHM